MDLIRRPGISTVGAIGATPNASGASVAGSTLTLQPADGSFGGVITTGTQILAGAKTWLSPVRSKPTGLAGLQLDCNAATGDFTLSLSPANLSANRRWTFPNRDDTFAGILSAQSFAGIQTFADATDATSTTAAALVVSGGVGVAKKLIVGISVAAPSVLTANIWENTTNGTSGVAFNYVGFNGGTTQFRNTDFYDGKNAIVASFIGSTKTLAISGPLEVSSATLIKSNTTLTNGAAAAAGTLLNAPVAGNPTKWISINDNGTTRYLPAW